MRPSQKIAFLYKRWRHGRGFGVHSPFAFRFITEVLRQKLGYYAYSRIDAACREAGVSRREAARVRQLFRIALDCGARRVAVAGPDPHGIIAQTLTATSSATELCVDVAAADMTVVTPGPHAPAQLPALIERAQNPEAVMMVVFVGATPGSGQRAAFEALRASMARGMTFDNGRDTAIAVMRPTLPRQDFSARF